MRVHHRPPHGAREALTRKASQGGIEMISREEAIRRMAPIAAAAWRELHRAWLSRGHAAVAAISSEQAAERYESWIDEDRRKRAYGSAA
jgi:hypothetical protein